ncbi:glycosyltransferase family 4 protein [Paenibacillus alkaliterrae]|uniref:glycosyltransferase family 4 protein n=1 Tax=Paenibacillus alkaliterrae TaxID=320909 RepID=UPI001F3AA9A5|nr:glycosyltransferase family 1 protein [Paenibacillus alkaliterrae]MCF2939765.1 glycosyltransferase family 4 protein [Paenibacillus alkaliterrae]
MHQITIDLRMLHNSGIGTYIRNLVPLVIRLFPDTSYNLIGNITEMKQYDWAQNKNITLIDCKSKIYSVSEQYELVRKIPKDTTLFWSPHYNIPILYRGKLLVTVHDVFHLAMPQFTGGYHKRLYAKGMFHFLRSKAKSIICISEFTQSELIRLTGKKKHQPIHVISNGVNNKWLNVEKKHSPHNKPYLLYVGNVKPNKNLKNLIKAFDMIKGQIPHDLLIVGKKEGFITGDAAVFESTDDHLDRLHFTGHVSEELLEQYFANADMLVFPSLYEGFGLPPLEAMACGCPVLVSSAASLPEVCGEAALYCDPYQPEDIAAQIKRLVSDSVLQDQLRAKGLEKAKQFTWDRCAMETAKVIREVLEA